jgi:hypothetical protein
VATGGVGQPLLLPALAVVALGVLLYVVVLRWAKVKSELDSDAAEEQLRSS